MSILVRREQEKYFFRLKTAVNYGTVKRQAGAEVSSLCFFLRSQDYTCRVVISSEDEDTTNNTKHPTIMDKSVDTLEQNKRFLSASFRNFEKHLFC